MRQFPIQFRAHSLKVPLVGAMVLYLKGPSCVSKCKQTMGHKKESTTKGYLMAGGSCDEA